MIHQLPQLPYAYNALEPYIDARTMEIHHTKHHQGYVDKLNNALKDHPQLATKPLKELLQNINQVPEAIRTAVRNNGGGHFNHSLFWQVMTQQGGGDPSGKIASAINKDFGSFSQFKQEFSQTALTRFGSGWAWLVVDKAGKMAVTSTPNQDSPIMEGQTLILGLDVWEHAYYLKYQNRRADYIEAWWNLVNWNQVEKNLKPS